MLDLLRLSLTDATVAGSRYAYTLESYRAMGSDRDGATELFLHDGVRLSIRTPEQARQRRRDADVRLSADDVQALVSASTSEPHPARST